MKQTLRVLTDRGPSTTTYTITGDALDVDREVSAINHQYHPYGYGTTLVSRSDHPGLPGELGYSRAVVTRSNSCD